YIFLPAIDSRPISAQMNTIFSLTSLYAARVLLALAASLFAGGAHAQPATLPAAAASYAPSDSAGAARPVAAVIDDCVREARRATRALRAGPVVGARAPAPLGAARAHFPPPAASDAPYPRAEGGRQPALPLGTLVNPVYSTLNQLLAAQGRPAEFGSVQNQVV